MTRKFKAGVFKEAPDFVLWLKCGAVSVRGIKIKITFLKFWLF